MNSQSKHLTFRVSMCPVPVHGQPATAYWWFPQIPLMLMACVPRCWMDPLPKPKKRKEKTMGKWRRTVSPAMHCHCVCAMRRRHRHRPLADSSIRLDGDGLTGRRSPRRGGCRRSVTGEPATHGPTCRGHSSYCIGGRERGTDEAVRITSLVVK
jgi:hypothetical protein